MTDQLFSEPTGAKTAAGSGPQFTAEYDSDDACCGDGIFEGEQIRADGEGGWIHAWCEGAVE